MRSQQQSARSVIVAGAGPAGMALAYLLARRGLRVTVLESHRDFSRAFRGEGLQRSGADALAQMGLAAQLKRLPTAEIDVIEMYHRGRLILRSSPAALGRGGAVNVSQPALLEMLAAEAGKLPGFCLRTGVTVRGLLRERGRIVGVRATQRAESIELRADLVIGADGRHSVLRKYAELPEILLPQGYDILWTKTPYPARGIDRRSAYMNMDADHATLAMPAADGQMQIGFLIRKGQFADRRRVAPEMWTEQLIGRLPHTLQSLLRSRPALVTGGTLLNVVCGRLTRWTLPGLLLIGDAAHPMSPVGGQGLNLALRDALVAANHLVPALTAEGTSETIDAAAERVTHERLPEIAAAQAMQDSHAKMMFAPDGLRTRIVQRLLPLLFRYGVLQWLKATEYRHMSEGFVPVRLTA